MPLVFGWRLSFLALSLSLISSAVAQSPRSSSVSPPHQSLSVKDLAAALAEAGSEEEQERLLTRDQALINSSLLAELKDLIRSRINKGENAQSLRMAQLAVRIAERIGDRAGLSDALTNLGGIYLGQYRYAEALNYLQKGLAIYEESGEKKGMADTLRVLGNLHSRQARYDQAIEHYNRGLALSKEVGDRTLTAQIFNDLGRTHDARGHYELGLEFLKKCLALSEELNNKDLQAIALNNLGIHYIDQGRYIDALEYLERSVKVLEEAGSANQQGMAVRLNNIGVIYKRQGRYDQALEYYRKSLKVMEASKDKLRIAESQNNIGVIYKTQGLYEQSLEWLRKSLKNFEEVRASGGIATSLNNIGDAYRRQGRYDLAFEALRESLRIREEVVKDSVSITLTLNNLGRLYHDQSRYSDMLEVSRRAAGLAEESNDLEGLWTARNGVGIALRALGQPAAARQSFLDAIATLELLRHQVAGSSQQQQSFLESRLSPWVNLIDLLVAQHQYTDALTIAEQSKARVLIDALQAGGADFRKSLSLEERQAEEQKRLQLVALNSQLTREQRRARPDASRVTELKAEIAKVRLEFEALETSIYVAHPELKVHRGEAPIIKTDELAALLPDTASAALEYVIADDKTFLFVITKAAGKTEAEVKVHTLPINRDELTRRTDVFLRQLAERDLGFRTSAAQLYELLLKPAEAQLRGKTSFVIAPDNKLWDLPFQALLPDGGRFLIEKASISYAPSLTVLREMTKRRKIQNTGGASTTLLALGNPMLGRKTIERATMTLHGEGLDSLPEAEQEVKALGQMYGAARSKVYIGQQAREDRVKNEAGGARILHFATHGTMNNASPMYSHLLLAQGDKNEDGLLEAWELMQLDLRAELAVLSACETARGRASAGEGMIGLTWAMFIAGVPSTVVSQWKVESASTRDLMLGFHSRLRTSSKPARAKMTKAEALRQAALKLMKNPGTSHPFYWAGFVLVGDGG
jgi:CHAT domain-containing protein/Tfp pilus assembly protein PilF